MSEFIKLLKTKIGCGYVLGSQGEIMTQALLDSLSHWNTSTNNTIAKKWIGKQCFDCSGLIVWALQHLRFIGEEEDYTASALYTSKCTPVTKEQLQPNDLVFIKDSRIRHVGIYIGDGKVIEAKGTSYGVVESTLANSGFNLYGRLKFELEPKEMTYAEANKIVCQCVKLVENYWGVKNKIDPYFEERVIKEAKFLIEKGLV